jgi:methyl-accepting chemotaxis protein
MKKQETGSRALTAETGTLQAVAQDVKTGSAEILEESRKVVEDGKNLEASAGRIRNGMDGIVRGMSQIESVIMRMQEIAQTNKNSIDTLAEDVSKFKVE